MAENYALIPEAHAMYTQTDALKETKDMSKNLVSGDYERQYRNGMMEKPSRTRYLPIIFAVSIGALAAWMVILTMVREVQITRLRHEVDELTANMIAMTANVKSLNQKIADDRIPIGFKTEDTFYADEDETPNSREDIKSADKDQQSYGSLEKLHDLTVLEDDTAPDDDEDMYDDDDSDTSGDWYQDYDRRRTKVGTTNMVKLKPEDFTDAVVTFEKEKHGLSKLRELKRLLNENPGNPDIGLGFPTLPPVTEASDSARHKRSVFPDATPEALDTHAAPRLMTKPDESSRRKTKKFTPSGEYPPPTPPAPPARLPLHTVTRTVRNSNDEQRRPFVAAHFHGNTSHLSPEIHEHYKGNGMIRVSHGAAHDVWYPSAWTAASPHPRPTLTRNGHVHVHHTGVYLVYVQIYYLDTHDIISWVLHRTNADTEGRETLLQCAQSSHSNEVLDKPNSCFSASALLLRAGDRLAVRNTGGDRHSLMQPEKSFIGLIKLADAEDPNEEF